MVMKTLCPPALIYLIFSITQVSIDTVRGEYNTALVKIWVAFVFTILLNHLCLSGLNVVSWLIVFIPFILMTIIVSMLLLMLGLDPTTGKLNIINKKDKKRKDIRQRIRERQNNLDRFTSEEYQKWRKYKELAQLNSKYDESNISQEQQEVLDNVISTRADLDNDPMQRDEERKY